MKMILAVDDNEDDLLLLQYALSGMEMEHRLITAADGVEAELLLQDIQNGQNGGLPAVMFLDINMPRRNGLQVLKWLKSQPGLKGIPVVILSASENPNELEKALELGAVACLCKPPSRDTMQVLFKTLAEAGTDRQVRPKPGGERVLATRGGTAKNSEMVRDAGLEPATPTVSR
jgi:CheY-like chemotaxis protein